jgi:hypothetical protein
MVAFAGGIAEARFRGRKNRVGAKEDRLWAFDLASSLCGDDRETSAYLNWLFARARNLVLSSNCWPGAERLAAELLARQTLNGREARQAFDSGLLDALSPEVREATQALKIWAASLDPAAATFGVDLGH